MTDPIGDSSQNSQAERGGSSDDLLPVLYDELRRLAQARMARMAPGNTLQPTALVHEVYLRLVQDSSVQWNSRGHFFGAAALAMRRILVEQARRKGAVKHGGGQQRLDVDDVDLPIELPVEDILALERALERLEKDDPRKAQIVMLRYYAGLDRDEIADSLDVSVRTVDREWKVIVARLHKEISATPDDET